MLVLRQQVVRVCRRTYRNNGHPHLLPRITTDAPRRRRLIRSAVGAAPRRGPRRRPPYLRARVGPRSAGPLTHIRPLPLDRYLAIRPKV
ncbi:hypothetical protein EVAR_88618_1 [Eumeta japonica]|uniref:Uncharacterized protein n=1 Tax=Eumeta variegata TaxID=151549 RepID=A0A4C1X3P0_EUMVA|nr:hypothetical protein EVAR_88618_1 [Eumeta japonica]